MTGASETAVLICTRDRGTLLAGCLEAVLRCEPAPAEVVVVDQSAGGASREAVARSQGRGAPIRYVRGIGTGLSRARNQGIAECGAAILAFTDDDCLVDRGWLAALTDPIRAGRADAVVGRTLPEEGGAGGETTFSCYAPARVPVFTRRTHPWRLGGGGNFAATRAALLQAGPYDERFGPGAPLESAEDMDMIHRLLRGGVRIVHAPQAVVRHRSWRSPEQNRRLARAYGVGAGGYFAKHFLAGDLISGWRFVARAGIRAVHLARALAARDRREMAGQAAYLAGLFAGAGRYARGPAAPASAAAEPERGAA